MTGRRHGGSLGWILVAGALWFPLAPGAAEDPPAHGPVNLDFEAGAAGWGGGGTGFERTIDETAPFEGKRCARIHAPAGASGFATWVQGFPAEKFRGATVRLTGQVRTEGVTEGWAGLWMRVDGAKDQVLAFDNMAERGITGTRPWQPYEVVLECPAHAEWICVGLIFCGQGTAWVDALKVERVEAAGAGTDAAACAPLGAKGRQHLVGLARVWGVVRYFSAVLPSSGVDWEAALVEAVPEAEGAKDAAAARAALDRLVGRVEGVAAMPGDPQVRRPGAPGLEELGNEVILLRPDLGRPEGAIELCKPAFARARTAKAVVVDLRGSVGPGAEAVQRTLGPLFSCLITQAFSGAGKLRMTHRGLGATGAAAATSIYGSGCAVSGRTALMPREEQPEHGRLFVLTDERTSPFAADLVAGLQAAGRAWVIGRPFPARAEAPFAASWLEHETYPVHLAALAAPGHDDEVLRWIDPDVPVEASAGGGRDDRDVAQVLALVRAGQEPPRAEPRERKSARAVAGAAQTATGLLTRPVRLAAVIALWNALRYFYPYWEVVKADWDAALVEALGRAATDATPAALQRTLRRLLACAQDGHGYLRIVGVTDPMAHPALLLEWIEGQPVVVAAGAQATAAGVRPGMAVAKIDGRPADAVLADLLAETSAATPQFRHYRAMGWLLTGAPGTSVTLGLADRGGKGIEVALPRTLEDVPALVAKTAFPAHRTLEGGIEYVHLGMLDDGAFTKLLDALGKAPGVIFDLRGYPSVSTMPLQHLIGETVLSAHMDIPIVTHPDRARIAWTEGGWPLMRVEPRLPGKVVFVTDGRAISYAETYLALVKQNHIAPIVGEATAGTNGNITTVVLLGRVQVTFTGMRVTNNDGSVHHGVGVLPDVEVHRTMAGVEAGRDELLEKALEVVRGGK